MSNQRFELRLSLLELHQHLVLAVSARTGSLLGVQESLGNQLLLDPSLQGTRVRGAARAESTGASFIPQWAM